MFARYQGHIGAYLVLAGADSEGGHLYSIHAHGSTDKTPYTANGSGMLAAMAVLETGWKPGRSLMTNLLSVTLKSLVFCGKNYNCKVL